MNYWLLLIPICLIGFTEASGIPLAHDSDFIVEKFVTGLKLPTTMAFVSSDEILVLEKATGNVRLIRDGVLQSEPVLNVKVNFALEHGLVGITTLDSNVFIYFTAANNEGESLSNQVFQYVWDGEQLIEEKQILDLPVNPEIPQHIGGAMTVNSEGDLFVIIGDVGGREGILQNFEKGTLDDSSVILKINPNDPILKPSESDDPLSYYYAMGIRNGFGLAVDPITGYLWDTENGTTEFDEINLVKPKFNSGWKKILGPATEVQVASLPNFHDFQYSDPEFSWETTVAPTGLTFVTSDFFDSYKSYLLVGDFNTGTLYKFKLNSERTGFVFENPQLSDLIQNDEDNIEEIVFASGFAGITDLDFGNDGFLYVVSLIDGSIYRITPYSPPATIPVKFPLWIKNVVSWWADKQIDDSTLIESLKFLIENYVIVISKIPDQGPVKETIPSWFKTNATSWINEKSTKEAFTKDIEFLISSGLIHLDKTKIKCNHPIEVGIDLSGCNLSKRDFSNLDLSHSQMARVILSGADLSKSDLTNIDLTNSILDGAMFVETNLRGAKLTNSDLTQTLMQKAQMQYSVLEGANLKNSNMERANLQHANLMGANMEGVNLKRAQIQHANMEKVYLSNADLSNAKLNSVNLTNAILINANLTNADLRGANMQGADFKGAITNGCKGCPHN